MDSAFVACSDENDTCKVQIPSAKKFENPFTVNQLLNRKLIRDSIREDVVFGVSDLFGGIQVEIERFSKYKFIDPTVK